MTETPLTPAQQRRLAFREMERVCKALEERDKSDGSRDYHVETVDDVSDGKPVIHTELRFIDVDASVDAKTSLAERLEDMATYLRRHVA